MEKETTRSKLLGPALGVVGLFILLATVELIGGPDIRLERAKACQDIGMGYWDNGPEGPICRDSKTGKIADVPGE